MSLTKKGSAWELAQSWYILLAFTGFFSWAAFLYIGIRTNQRKWWGMGIVYFLPFAVLFFYGAQHGSGSWQMNTFAPIWLVSIVATIVHAFLVRKEFLLRLAAHAELKWKANQDLKNSIELQYDVDLDDPLHKRKRNPQPAPTSETAAGSNTVKRNATDSDMVK
ncbi:hypothetical protein JJB07_01505 [Tumebacillus sp. ITR2]|uniref:Uncharacterized protein n=1 Tax=Tumebacillus amylolyticus TaxID=2801339 RepID=A0ABS1J5J7_9BACL|nr:hypothetical protein [Tumebacillus amylolyticus]MBL0385309.1 hypothetical protein [Tumebacillus amylolyticus]